MFEKNTEVTGTSSHRAKHSNVSIYYSLGCKQGKAITAGKKKRNAAAGAAFGVLYRKTEEY